MVENVHVVDSQTLQKPFVGNLFYKWTIFMEYKVRELELPFFGSNGTSFHPVTVSYV